MRVALAQINSFLGDFAGNKNKILDYIYKSKERQADIVVFPECALFGYHPMDLLECAPVVEEQLRYLNQIHTKMPKGIVALVGVIAKNPKKLGKPYLNAAALIQKEKPIRFFSKELLPTYDVFDEGRHIEAGQMAKNIFSFRGKKILVTICEDIWAWDTSSTLSNESYSNNPLKKIKKSAVDVVLNLSASPFTEKKFKRRINVVGKTAKHFSAPLVYVNMVGAQDELIFDGGSFAIDKSGKVLAQSIRYQEDLNLVDLKTHEGGFRTIEKNDVENQRQAAVLGIRDYVRKTGFKKVHLGLSGGIDSALVACLAVDALGPSNVKCIALPTKFNAGESYDLAKKLTDNLGVEFISVPIQSAYETLLKSFEENFDHSEFDLVNENFQARIRGTLLMAISNNEGSMLLATSNKSELAMGYSTLYGDMNGGLMPIGDLLKTEVFELARHYNKDFELIPERIITRPPSAELRPGQKDEDTLPPYGKLDPVVEKIVENLGSPRGKLEKRVMGSLFSSEFKRWQGAPVLKLSQHAFGMGRRLPIAHCALKEKLK